MWLGTQVLLTVKKWILLNGFSDSVWRHLPEGLIPSTADLRDLTQYKYAKQTVLPTHLNVITSLTSFLTN